MLEDQTVPDLASEYENLTVFDTEKDLLVHMHDLQQFAAKAQAAGDLEYASLALTHACSISTDLDDKKVPPLDRAKLYCSAGDAILAYHTQIGTEFAELQALDYYRTADKYCKILSRQKRISESIFSGILFFTGLMTTETDMLIQRVSHGLAQANRALELYDAAEQNRPRGGNNTIPREPGIYDPTLSGATAQETTKRRSEEKTLMNLICNMM